MQFPPPKKSSEQFSGEPYPVADGRPSFVFPPPQSLDPSTPFEVAEKVAGKVVELQDGMTDLNDRVDLMEDVSGYGGMVMSTNRRFVGGDNYKVVPFDTPYGPSTPSVNLDRANNRIGLAKGTWSVSILLVVPQAGILGGPTWFRATITAYRPNGTEYLNQWLDWRSGENPHGYFAQVPLIVPDDSGYYVKVRFTHNTGNWRLLGGTDRSKFWVNRWDLRTDDNNMILDPPEGPDVT